MSTSIIPPYGARKPIAGVLDAPGAKGGIRAAPVERAANAYGATPLFITSYLLIQFSPASFTRLRKNFAQLVLPGDAPTPRFSALR